MLFTAKVTICSELHTKHIYTHCRQNVELLNVKPDGSRTNHQALVYLLDMMSKFGVISSVQLLANKQLFVHNVYVCMYVCMYVPNCTCLASVVH
jgi:hypothetical protein